MCKCRWDVLPPLSSCMSSALNHGKSAYRDGGHSVWHYTTGGQCRRAVVIVWGIESVLGRCGELNHRKSVYWDGGDSMGH